MTFEELFRIIKRRKKGIFVAVAFSCASAAGYHVMKVPEYHAVSLMMISDNGGKEQGDLFTKVVGPEQGMIDNTKSVKKDAEVLRSMTFAEMAVREIVNNGRARSMELFGMRSYLSPAAIAIMPLLPHSAFGDSTRKNYSNEEIRRFAIRLNNRIRVDPVRETNIIKISVASPFPDESAYLTNTLCRLYRDIDINQNSAKYAQANRFISSMIQQQSVKLDNADAALSGYMSRHEIYEVSGNTEELLKKLVEVDAHYNDLQAELNITRNNLDFLNGKLTEAEKELGNRISQTVTTQLGSIMDEVRSNESEYVRLVREKGIDAPETTSKKQQLDLLKARYEQLSRSKIAGQIGYIGRTQKYSFDVVSEKLQIERKLNDLSFSAKEFGRVKKHYETQLSGLPVKQQEYIRLQRDRDAISKTYVFLKEKLDESRILIGSEMGSVSLLGAAFCPIKPESPDIKKTLILGLFFGGLFAVAYTIGAESLDTTIRNVSFFRELRFRRVFRIPFAGVQHARPVMPDGADPAFAESFRMMLAYLDNAMNGRNCHTMLVACCGDDEGASTTTANLGIASAFNGTKTLIIDMNTVDPVQGDLFRIPDAQDGVSDYLLGSESVNPSEYIQRTDIDNLYVLCAGRQYADSGQYFGGTRMAALFEGLKQSFDMLLIDAAPLSRSETVRLAGLVDGVILAARLGKSKSQAVKEISQDEFIADRILGVAVIDELDTDIFGNAAQGA